MPGKWSIWYEDGTNCTDQDAEPYEVGRHGVQVIVQDDGRSGRYNQCMDDVYVWKDGRWYGMDRIGMLIYLMTYPHPCIVLFGTTVDADTWQATLEKAEADPYLPPRSAKRRGEIVP